MCSVFEQTVHIFAIFDVPASSSTIVCHSDSAFKVNVVSVEEFCVTGRDIYRTDSDWKLLETGFTKLRAYWKSENV